MSTQADEDRDEWELQIAVVQTVISNLVVLLEEEEEEANNRKRKKDENFRNNPRNQRRHFRHGDALHCIKRDYLGLPGDPTTPLFIDADFKMMFRITRGRFQRLMEDIGNSGDPFYLKTTDALGKPGTSMEARLLLPLKSLAYGVPPHTFTDYFQMSKTLAKKCCNHFDKTIKKLYEKEYLRLPTKADVENVLKLHKAVHGVEGMFGSIDCMHTYWKNCPVGWQGSFKGKEKKPSIVLEAVSDHHMWFWHAAYGYAGTMNDTTILHMSPLLDSFIDGSFAEMESTSVPFKIGEEEFNKCYVLADGIYPAFSRFVKGIQVPISQKEKVYTSWQEAVRKDIERAFGVFQAKWQVFARPIHTLQLGRIATKMGCCMILHNMCVADRVMGDPRAWYNPAEAIGDIETVAMVRQPKDLATVQGKINEDERARVGFRRGDAAVQALILKREAWKDLIDEEEHIRLHKALMDLKFKRNT
jgi:hypothetical protein